MPWRKQDTLSLLLRLRGDFDGDAPRGGTTRLRTGYATVGGIAQAHGLFCATLPLYMPKLIHLAFREPVMLIKRRCPHTGVVNFFSHAEPHMAVGSIVPRDDHHFTWRYYAEPFVRGGQADDMFSAEREVRELSRLAAREQVSRPC